MANIKIEKGTEEKLRDLNVENWGQWSCEESKFDWEYDFTETCYLYEGQVKVTTTEGEEVNFGAGDIVVFPKGLKCTWDVSKPVRKRFRFD